MLHATIAELRQIDAVEQMLTRAEHDRRYRHVHLIDQPGAAVLGSYTRGGTVFTTGCTEWVRGLAGRDPMVERITRNVLDRLSGRNA